MARSSEAPASRLTISSGSQLFIIGPVRRAVTRLRSLADYARVCAGTQWTRRLGCANPPYAAGHRNPACGRVETTAHSHICGRRAHLARYGQDPMQTLVIVIHLMIV